MKVHRKKIITQRSLSHPDAGQPFRKKTIDAPIAINDKATKRVIAPFVRIVRKGQKPIPEVEDTQFSMYLQRKPSVLTRDLSLFISDSVDVYELLHQSSDVLKRVIKATGVTTYIIDMAANEIFLSVKGCTLERFKIRWKIRQGTTVAAYVAHVKDYVMVDDVLLDERFPEGIGYEGETVKAVLCVPVVTPEDDCFAIIELYRQLFDPPFTNDDFIITLTVTSWMGAAIYENQQRLALKRQQELNDYLLDLTKCYFAEMVQLEKMAVEIIKFAKVTLRAERTSFFIIDLDSEDLMSDMFDDGVDEKDPTHIRRSTRIRLGKDKSIAAIVAKTGVTINVKDAYNDPRFNKEVDQKTGYITRSILCIPVVGSEGVILGVLQVVNKQNNGYFSNTDENLFKTFSSYCALALRYTKVFKNMENTGFEDALNNKILRLQLKPCIHDIEHFLLNPNVDCPKGFNTFEWYLTMDQEHKMPALILYMFNMLLGGSKLHGDNLMRFILTVRKVHRPNPFNNFHSSFIALHCFYMIAMRNLRKFPELELKALMLATLCHNIGHTGFTNDFLLLTHHDLACLYDDPYQENYSYDLTVFVLKDFHIFKGMTEDEDNTFKALLKKYLTFTNITQHFIPRAQLEKMIADETFEWSDPDHREKLWSALITICCRSYCCKPFLATRQSIANAYGESYAQGDVVKQMGLCPLNQFDREKPNSVPKDQVKYLKIILIPLLKIIATFFSKTDHLVTSANMICKTWQEVVDIRGIKCWRQDDSIVYK